MYFRIDTRLPSMNDWISANRANKYTGAKLKRETEETIGYFILAAKCRGQIAAVKVPVIIEIEWHESNKKRDADNIQSAQKFILDALQEQGILINDSRRYVKQIYHRIIDDTKDFVEVTLYSAMEVK